MLVRTNHNVVRTNTYVTLTYNAVAFTIHPPATNANGELICISRRTLGILRLDMVTNGALRGKRIWW